ncbi:MAG TPA: hypothetical protein VKC51_10340 [Lacunisphaera sp.]|nr:hypothetical protein [Lacunisphaera sp.]
MVASPADITEERQLVRDVINEWNSVNSGKTGIVLLPVGWEDSSAPEMGNRPQEILNQHVLKGADILVAIFWNRIGTPTGKKISGTVEEIEEHTKANKLAMVYFRRDESTSADAVQKKDVTEYKKSLHGLYGSYEKPIDFRLLFRQHLDKHVNEHATFAEKRPTSDEDVSFAREENNFDPQEHLSADAKKLLFEISEDKNGLLLACETHDGFSITVNEREFVATDAPKEKAKWRRVIKELLDEELIEQRSEEVFAITDKGYQAEDEMGLVPP